MDEKKLTQIANKTETSRAMFKALGDRQRDYRMMDVRRLKYELEKDGFDVVPEDFMQSFKELEKAGIGKLIRKPKQPVRFEWSVSLKEVAEVVKKEIEPPAELHSPLPMQKAGQNTEVHVMLGPSREAYVQVPTDLTTVEAQFLYRALMSKVRG